MSSSSLKKSPLARVKEEFGGKDKLVDKIVGVLDSGDESKDELRKRLLGVANTQADPPARRRHQHQAGGRPRQAGGDRGREAGSRQGQGLRRQAEDVLERPAARHAVGGRAPQRQRPRPSRRAPSRARPGRRAGQAGRARPKAAAKPAERQGGEVGRPRRSARAKRQPAVRHAAWAGSSGGSGRRGRPPASPGASCCSSAPRRRPAARRPGWSSRSTGWTPGPGDRVIVAHGSRVRDLTVGETSPTRTSWSASSTATTLERRR